MKKIIFVLLSIALIVVGLSACAPAPEGPQIEISGVWGRPSPMKAGNGAVYMLISNTGSEDDKLISAYADVAEVVELHDMTMEDDIMKMFHVEYMEVPAGGSVELKPGSKHIMFIGLFEKLEVGQIFSVELEFEKAGKMTVDVEVKEAE
ncbi:MAG: copper chaperone PCu(A)C [Anaerolineae bacterium]|jgi:periplasmic copper chaperone A|nr:copper chaperone PCu(A)C [Anaerolineae bacterium]MBT7191062.1 copper chaperone PCu(A)C [Anaerolineae bacterium]